MVRYFHSKSLVAIKFKPIYLQYAQSSAEVSEMQAEYFGHVWVYCRKAARTFHFVWIGSWAHWQKWIGFQDEQFQDEDNSAQENTLVPCRIINLKINPNVSCNIYLINSTRRHLLLSVCSSSLEAPGYLEFRISLHSQNCLACMLLGWPWSWDCGEQPLTHSSRSG
jgi:hypothetical protein